MKSYAVDFGPFNGKIWLNASAIGAMPRVAKEAVHEAVSWNVNPPLLEHERFEETPQQLKNVLGQLISAPSQDIILGNSASYGLHLWANGFSFKPGDEILLVKGDFPATILPWLALREKGVKVREIQPTGPVLQVEDVKAHLTDATKILCATWVDSFTGFAIDEKEIGQYCQDKGVWFLLNCTQGLGARELDVSRVSVDGVNSCGYKWLCGPYGTGFCWMRPELLKKLDYNQAYWLVMQGDRDLDQMRDYQLRDNLGAERFDVFCTANFFNFIPWTKSVEYLVKQGISNIQNHNDRLVEHFIEGLDSRKYHVLSPKTPPDRTAIVIGSHQQVTRNKELFEYLIDHDVYLSLREGNLRFSPHLYNTLEEIDSTLSILNKFK